MTYIFPNSARYFFDNAVSKKQTRVVFQSSSAACFVAAVAMLYACVPLVLPSAISISAYIALYFTVQSIFRAANCIRGHLKGSSAHDVADHTLHFVCASAGVAYAICTRPPPRDLNLLLLVALWSILLVRVISHRFPF